MGYVRSLSPIAITIDLIIVNSSATPPIYVAVREMAGLNLFEIKYHLII